MRTLFAFQINWRRTILLPPEPIVTFKRVSYLKVLVATFQNSPTNWDKSFGDLKERVLKRMHILRVYKRNGYNVCDLDYLFNCLTVRHFLLTVSEFGVLRLIANTLVKLIGY